ncbi:hypothetical protein [Actinomadura terrae]|uniref:hypothetical protein n=1 Tax=Actinomadura terrae TaxID=604353 RepID=UPI001FA7680B|nr:hypothetical protein [Actinomadura terrae]
MTGMVNTPGTRRAGMWKAPRSRGMISGLLLVLLGLWGGLIPFIGPYFDFGFGSSDAWVYNTDRLVLSILPAIAVGVGGLILLASANRPLAMIGSWLAILGGLWFVVGTTIAVLWNADVGAPLGGEGRQVAERLSFFQGLGALSIMLAAMALGRFLVVGVREVRRAGQRRAEGERAAAQDEAGRGSTAAPEWERRPGPHDEGTQPSEPAERSWPSTRPSRR